MNKLEQLAWHLFLLLSLLLLCACATPSEKDMDDMRKYILPEARYGIEHMPKKGLLHPHGITERERQTRLNQIKLYEQELQK